MSRPQRVPHTSADLTAERLSALKDLIPEAFTEGGIDFDKLHEALGDFVDDAPERYSFTWAGKRDAIRQLQAPTNATLIPAPEESVNWDTTRHLFIEGDNLEVLKLLYKAYFGKVKLIYIDPPYNTGNDFIYSDNYKDPLRPYLELTGQRDADDNDNSNKQDKTGRYHSQWLTMMYPRLVLARQLLADDGVLFVSIDDRELCNLRLLCNAVFGEEMFIACFVWKSRQNKDNRTVNGASIDHEYILAFGKNIRGAVRDTTQYTNPDDDPRGPWTSANMVGLAARDRRPNLHYDLIDPATGINYGCPAMGWRYDPGTMARLIEECRILWPSSHDGRPRRKAFLAELDSEFAGYSTLIGEDIYTRHGTSEIDDLFGFRAFDFPKPTALLQEILEQGMPEDGVVLDFFGGSAATAHAALAHNTHDQGNRRFIMVQLPEPTGRPDYPTIADIGKERIRRVIARLNAEGATGDLGFRVFKLAPSHFQDWTGVAAPDPDDYVEQMYAFGDPLFSGADPQAVIWEAAIKEGFPLTSRVEKQSVRNHTIYKVSDADAGRDFHICLDNSVSDEVAAELGLSAADLFVCRDAALDDSAAANLALQCRLKVI